MMLIESACIDWAYSTLPYVIFLPRNAEAAAYIALMFLWFGVAN